LNVILFAFYELNEEKRQLTTIQFVKRIRNDVMRDAKRLNCDLNLTDVYVTICFYNNKHTDLRCFF